MSSTIASGSRVRLAYIAEVTQGVTPGSPALKILRATQRDINLTKNILTSNEVRSDRQKTDVRHGFTQVAGQLGFELSVGSYDDWLEAALSGTWSTVPTVTTVAAASSTTITRASGSFITDGYRPGDIISLVGFTATGNNANWRVISVVALTLTIDGPLTIESSGAGKNVVYPGKRLDIGTTLRTFTVERGFLDIVQYQVLKGCAVSQLALSIKPEAMIGGTFTVVGMDGTAVMTGTPLDAAPTTPSTNAPCDSFKGTIYEGGTLISVVTGVDFTLNNNRNVSAVVGSQISPEVFEGQAIVNGNLSAYFKNLTLFNKFVQETESSVWIKLADPNGTDFMNVVMPRVKYTGSPITPPSDGPIVLPMPFQALEHATYGTTLWLQRSN